MCQEGETWAENLANISQKRPKILESSNPRGNNTAAYILLGLCNNPLPQEKDSSWAVHEKLLVPPIKSLSTHTQHTQVDNIKPQVWPRPSSVPHVCVCCRVSDPQLCHPRPFSCLLQHTAAKLSTSLCLSLSRRRSYLKGPRNSSDPHSPQLSSFPLSRG